MTTKTLPKPVKGAVRLEDRYGNVGLKAVAGAIKPQKPTKS
jgi:hypothetical protein